MKNQLHRCRFLVSPIFTDSSIRKRFGLILVAVNISPILSRQKSVIRKGENGEKSVRKSQFPPFHFISMIIKGESPKQNVFHYRFGRNWLSFGNGLYEEKDDSRLMRSESNLDETKSKS